VAFIDELLVGLGFEYDPKEAKKFTKDLNKTVNSIKSLTRVAIGAAAALTGLTVASTLASDEQGKLANEIDDTVENIDALQFALRRSGGTADGMSNSLRTLAIRIAETARGAGSGIEAFGLLGISVHEADGQLKSASDLLLEISDRFNRFSKIQQLELADKLGIRDTIRLLQQGPQAIRELTDEAKRLGVTTAEDASVAKEFQESLTDIWQITKQLTRLLTRSLAPILKKGNKEFTEWFKINRKLIEQNLPKWIDQIVIGLKILTAVAAGFIAIKLITTITTLITLFRALSLSILAVNAAALILPILVGLAVAALAAVIEDIVVFVQGGESLLGDLIKDFPLLEKAAIKVKEVFEDINELIENITSSAPFASISEDIATTIRNTPILKQLSDFGKSLNPFSNDVPPESAANVKSSSIIVEKVEINVNGGINSPRAIAEEVASVFQQTTQDLTTVVEQ